MNPLIGPFTAVVIAAGLSANALAAGLLSPPLKIVSLEMVDGENVLRLIVRRRIEFDEPPFGFNPAGCTKLVTEGRLFNGQAFGNWYIFDLQLGAAGRTAAEQRQLVSETIAAFITSLPVTLYVPDDRCTPTGTRVVSGIRVHR